MFNQFIPFYIFSSILIMTKYICRFCFQIIVTLRLLFALSVLNYDIQLQEKKFYFFLIFPNQSVGSDLFALTHVLFAPQQNSRVVPVQVTLNHKLMRDDRLYSKLELNVCLYGPSSNRIKKKEVTAYVQIL